MNRSHLLPLLLFSMAVLGSAAMPAHAEGPGKEMYDDYAERGMIMEGEAAEYVSRVGQRVAAVSGWDKPFVFSLVDSGMVNAMALPDGYIFVFRGLFTRLQTEGQLAAVLGHEVAHVTRRHGYKGQNSDRLSRFGSTILGIFLGRAYYDAARGYSAAENFGRGREFELEADRFGAEYIGNAGYDPNEMFDLIRILADESIYMKEVFGRPPQYHGLFSTHPRSDRRLYEMIRMGSADADFLDLADLEGDLYESIDGLAFGDLDAEGVFRDRRFYHPDLGIVMDFPEGWLTSNGRQTISATAPHGSKTTITVEVKALEDDKVTAEAFLRTELGIEPTDGRAIEVDTLQGYLAVVPPAPQDASAGVAAGGLDGEEGDADKGEAPPEPEYRSELVAVVVKDGFAYVFRGENRLETYEPDFLGGFSRTVASFRRMRREDLEAAVTTRIALVEAKPEDTYEQLARKAQLGRDGADVLRLLNGDFPLGQPRAGDLIKVIE